MIILSVQEADRVVDDSVRGVQRIGKGLAKFFNGHIPSIALEQTPVGGAFLVGK